MRNEKNKFGPVNSAKTTNLQFHLIISHLFFTTTKRYTKCNVVGLVPKEKEDEDKIKQTAQRKVIDPNLFLSFDLFV